MCPGSGERSSEPQADPTSARKKRESFEKPLPRQQDWHSIVPRRAGQVEPHSKLELGLHPRGMERCEEQTCPPC